MLELKKPVVIIGTGLAGYNLAREWRKLDGETPLVMISRDSGRSYSKPMLSTGFQKSKTDADLTMADAGTMAEQLNASIHTFQEVGQIDVAAKTLSVDGTTIEYRDLVLATGSSPIPLPFENSASNRTFAINDLEQYATFRSEIREGQTVLIVGGGLIGCEYANDLSLAGYNVTLIERESRLLSTLVHPDISQALLDHFKSRNIDVHLDTTVESLESSDRVIAHCHNGNLTGDIVLSAIGVRAETSLANKSGVVTNRGIVVNRALETSAPNVYALGDCAEVEGHLLYYIMPLMLCARALAKTLAGQRTEVSYPAMPVTIKTTEYPIVSQLPKSPEGSWQVTHTEGGIAALCHNQNGDLVGYCLSGSEIVQRAALTKQIGPTLA